MSRAATLEAPMADRHAEAARVAVVGALAATTMLFASLVSAYLVRRSFADWRANEALWPVALLACAVVASAGVEAAGRAGGEERRRFGLRVLGLFSAAYLVGALGVIASVVTGPSGLASPHDAFVVLLLGVHAVHALLGMGFASSMFRGGSEIALPLVRLVTHFLTLMLFGIVFVLFGLR